MSEIYMIGEKTPYGNICAIHSSGGERSYMCIDDNGVTTLIPHDVLKVGMEATK